MIGGVLFWGGFNWSMELSNTERFCVSCHEMADNVFKELKKTVHYENRTGVRATCPDCHVPKEWNHKVIRKVLATRELYHWLAGTVSTSKKFEERRMTLASHVWKSMKKTDSRECRNCHDNNSMKLSTQTRQAGLIHELALKWEMTCIDCHKGIAHKLPVKYDFELVMDELHERFEVEKIKCITCHEDLSAPPKGEEW